MSTLRVAAIGSHPIPSVTLTGDEDAVRGVAALLFRPVVLVDQDAPAEVKPAASVREITERALDIIERFNLKSARLSVTHYPWAKPAAEIDLNDISQLGPFAGLSATFKRGSHNYAMVAFTIDGIGLECSFPDKGAKLEAAPWIVGTPFPADEPPPVETPAPPPANDNVAAPGDTHAYSADADLPF